MGTNADYAPFLLLSIREDATAADDEYAAIMRFADLDEVGLRRIVLTDQELGPIDLGDWSGIVLGGGPFNVSDPDGQKGPTQLRVERELFGLIRSVIEQDFPFLGCCYGVGTLGTAIGARIDATYSEPVGAVTVTLTDAGATDHLFASMPQEFDAYGGHKEAVTELPRGAVSLASSPDCPVQAFRVGRNAYATQFHPELDVDGLCTRIDAYSGHGYFAPEAAETLKADARQRSVTSPPMILRNFVGRYRRPGFQIA